jgi:Na+-driven multidrug efflux pump
MLNISAFLFSRLLSGLIFFLYFIRKKKKTAPAIIKTGLFKVVSKTHNSRLFTLSLFILTSRLFSRRGCVTGTPLLLLLSKKYAIAFFRIPT